MVKFASGWVTFLLLSLWMPGLQAAHGELANDGSPYLRLHANDPVHWHRWTADSLAAARKDNRIVFLSIGYYACHWCHVMQRESFQNPEIAAYLNAHFVPVKVDREVEPVLDEQMMLFLESTRGRGGWPLNVFLTPEGYPLIGMVYLPPDEFLDFVKRLNERWQKEHDALADLAQRGWQDINREMQRFDDAVSPLGTEEVEALFIAQAMKQADELSGGFGQQSKFPQVPQLRALLELATDPGHAELREFLVLTLDAMATRGLRDQVDGGFFRYTIDPHWDTPHFEKMLYDNAQLAGLYLRAARVLERPDYAAVGHDTLRFLRESMRATSQGGADAFVASLSAVDDRNIEGGYYLWHKADLAALLARDWAIIEPLWALDQASVLPEGYLPFAHRTHAQVAANLSLKLEDVRAAEARAFDVLREARRERVLPVDDKRLTGWNGLLLSALVLAAEDGNATARADAVALAQWLQTVVWDEKAGVLARGVDAQGRTLGTGQMADYAYAIEGLVALAELTGEARYWAFARSLAHASWSRFHREGRWYVNPESLLPTDAGMRSLPDEVLPSPSATLVRAAATIARHVDDAVLADKVSQQRGVTTRAITQVPFYHASWIVMRRD